MPLAVASLAAPAARWNQEEIHEYQATGCCTRIGSRGLDGQCALAHDQAEKPSKEVKTGQIARLDMANKMMVVAAATHEGKPLTGAEAREWAVYWDAATVLEGASLREGEVVHMKTADKGGKTFATWVHVGPLEKQPYR